MMNNDRNGDLFNKWYDSLSEEAIKQLLSPNPLLVMFAKQQRRERRKRIWRKWLCKWLGHEWVIAEIERPIPLHVPGPLRKRTRYGCRWCRKISEWEEEFGL